MSGRLIRASSRPKCSTPGSSGSSSSTSRPATARFLTEPSLAAGCPLWSPDGRSIALAYSRRSGLRGVGIVGADGTGFHDIGGALEGRSASGTNSWSPDGAWVYFDAPSSSGNGGLFRANVDGRFSQPVDGLQPVCVCPGSLAGRDPDVVHRREDRHVRPLRGGGRRRQIPTSSCRTRPTKAGRRTASSSLPGGRRPAAASRPFARTARISESSCRSRQGARSPTARARA